MKIFLDALSRVPTVSVGTQALILGSMHIIKRRFPDAEFVMLSAAPAVERSYLDGTPFQVRLVQRSPGQIGTMRQIRQIVCEVDAVVSAWGDGYSTFPPHLIFRKTLVLKRRHKPLVLFTASIGPFQEGWRGAMARWGLAVFDRLTVRDMNTCRYMKALGLPDVRPLPDTAFAMPPSSAARIQEVLRLEQIPAGAPLIGVNLSILLHHKMGQAYTDLILRLIQHLRNTAAGAHIVLIPHQFYPVAYTGADKQMRDGRDGDDRVVIERIYSALPDPKRVTAVRGEYSPEDYKGLISRCEMFIGGRMHSVVAALSTCVPSVIMEYSHKAGGVMEMLGLEDTVWNIHNDPQQLLEKVSAVWGSRQERRARLLATMPAINEQAYATGDVLAEVLAPERTQR